MSGKCENQPYLVLMKTTKAIQERIKREMISNKLNITEFSVLEVLYLQGKQTIQQIGNTILISSGSMTYVIDKLECKGLLSRSGCPDDRRVIHVILTEEGTHLMKEIMPNHRDLVNYMFGSLTDNESETMVKLLQKVSTRVGT
ncbi:MULTISPECIES: MarR family winged helix-turn-helix transcriptional regulator [unclassified Sporosarcina]|uniref:MarR family winged helix-turn-helix transcriptional regulator n=2 Tax=Sporosarcina TaxID=1569 RepID=UPI00203C6D9A|nr:MULTISPECIES: MarR family transcriptional regulator [unclassified Sporosarcina]GKV67012.1 MarR family transcriptional regulator [Sporosarcina sp. NCCP-2331]GLB57342.1 MarR family transcriptional regulator [Sporosarcina sp. NCCP-2378]